MLPPPAPTSAMSIVGMRSSSPAPRISRLPAEIEPPTSYSRPRAIAPFSISEALAVVPPMSNAIRFSSPSLCDIPSAATTPAAGPDSRANTGRSFASSEVITPPDDCMICERRVLEPDPVEAGADPVDVRRHQRSHVGVDDGRRRPLVLTLLPQDLARERDRRGGKLLGEDRPDALLVLGVEIGVQEADGDRVDGELAEPGRQRAHLRIVERLHDRSVRCHPLGELEAQPALDEGWRLAPEEVVHVRDPQAPELEDVAEPSRRDQGRLGAETLQNGVRRHRGAVHDLRHRDWACAAGEPGDRLDHGQVVARWRREELAHLHPPVGRVEQDVGERAAHIDADPAGNGLHHSLAHLRFGIANCILDELRANCPGMEELITPIAPLEERESIEQRVARTLRDLIVAGQLPSGTPLVQRDLAKQLGVSPTPVRAGLSQLEREGFVAVTTTGRAVVSRLTREDFEEIYAARLGLEGLAARVGAVSVGPTEITQMKRILRRLRELAVEQDVDAYLHQRWEFHATCYRSSGRQRLVDEVERLFWRSDRYNRLVLSTAERFRESVGRYRELLVACEARDGTRAEQAVADGMRWAVDRLASALPSETDE